MAKKKLQKKFGINLEIGGESVYLCIRFQGLTRTPRGTECKKPLLKFDSRPQRRAGKYRKFRVLKNNSKKLKKVLEIEKYGLYLHPGL